MSKKTKIWLVIATSLVVVGLILFTVVMTVYHWDFTKLSTEKYETNTYEISQPFRAISMNTDTADILFVVSDEGMGRVVCYEEENSKHSVSVQEGNLSISVADDRGWYEYIGINFSTPKITVYIPRGQYGALLVRSSTGDIEIPKDFRFESIDIRESTGNIVCYAPVTDAVKMKTSTGSICVENGSANTLDLSVSTGGITVSDVACRGDVTIEVSTGKTSLSDVTCKSVISRGDTGDISLKNVFAAEKFAIERGTGDVTFDGADAAEIVVRTDTGDVTGTLLSQKTFMAESDTGRVDVPKTVTGGRCEITTGTGDIRIKISQ